ncbi:MAG: hypothetical protein FJZ01_01410 [Candidatus Sericytochromatia bacterium]|nr:hypothetical protein [Candidatus Tanganyikabacteria bacterium]
MIKRALLVLVSVVAVVSAVVNTCPDGTLFSGPTHPTEPGGGKGRPGAPIVKA